LCLTRSALTARGYIKPATVAWYADRKRLASGKDDPYAFCYLYRYSIALPDDAQTLTLPNAPGVRLLAATITENSNDAEAAVQLVE